MTAQITCAKIDCVAPASYDKPLCYKHWQEFDRYQISECENCHRFDEMVGVLGGDQDLCWDCAGSRRGQGKEIPTHNHAPVEHQTRYLYILKLDGGTFYVGQTNDLEMRLKEHQDGSTSSTRGKHPELVWFRRVVGDREFVNEEEQRLTLLNKNNPRRIRRMVADWQRLIRLVSLED
ncbi:MAG TPA: GIY-YIG nuclease family protein [Dehalococcoidia bacterium]|nr:GIY-YIG nuclease family protein [Dehalococcoidia bacterium]